MSNRNRHEGNRGFAKPQQKFVPKQVSNASKDDVKQTLSNSIRQSHYRESGSSSSSSASVAATSSGAPSSTRVAMVDKVELATGNFVNYLPQDEAVASGLGADAGGLDPVESQRTADLLNKELSRLLKLSPRDFWREVASDTSLHSFLESYLKFRSRWYDFPYHGAKGMLAGVIVGEYELSRRVFMVLYRISSNKDPGARTADSLSPNDHTVILQGKKLLDLPKLLDICALYSHENQELTRLLVVNAINAQPWIHDDLTGVSTHFLNVVNTMYYRCTSSVEVLFSVSDHQDHRSARLHLDYLEVMDFINDAVVSMDAFVDSYNLAAIFFSCPVEMSYGNDELLITLAKLHDSLLPSLQRGFRHMSSDRQKFGSVMISNVAMSLKMLSNRIVEFGWKLLYLCYLSNEIFEENFQSPAASKIFPAQVEDLTIRADILVQTLREISEVHLSIVEVNNRGSFLQNIDKTHSLMERINFLQTTGYILMEDEQITFISGILRRSVKPIMTNNMSNGSFVEVDEDNAIVESKISQIKDLFPDYGKGFLSACLEVYNQNPEEVIQRILEGTLHHDLQTLDTSLQTAPHKPKPVPATSAARPDKGKGILIESPPLPTATPTTVTETSTAGPAMSSSSSAAAAVAGRFVRKSSTLPKKVLDAWEDKQLVKTMALIEQMKLEYEDEYDDSFDELGLSVADSGGFEETDMFSIKNKSSSDNSDNPSDSTKWGSRKKPQFYVKDGKNYGYKVPGSIAVANINEASVVNQSQRETIHGLGRGGNRPLGAVKKVAGWKSQQEEEDDDDEEVEGGAGRGQPGNFRARGRGRRGGGGGRKDSYRKDQAMKKHFSGLTGY